MSFLLILGGKNDHRIASALYYRLLYISYSMDIFYIIFSIFLCCALKLILVLMRTSIIVVAIITVVSQFLMLCNCA